MKKNNILFHFISNSWHKHAKWPPSSLTPWTLTLPLGLNIECYKMTSPCNVWFYHSIYQNHLWIWPRVFIGRFSLLNYKPKRLNLFLLVFETNIIQLQKNMGHFLIIFIQMATSIHAVSDYKKRSYKTRRWNLGKI